MALGGDATHRLCGKKQKTKTPNTQNLYTRPKKQNKTKPLQTKTETT